MSLLMGQGERDELYRSVVLDLGAFGDLGLAIQAGDVAEAKNLRSHFDTLTELLDGLGWEPQDQRMNYSAHSDRRRLARFLTELHARAQVSLHDDRRALATATGQAAVDLTAQAETVERLCLVCDSLLRRLHGAPIDIVAERINRGLSTRDAAHEIGVSQAVVRRAEHRKGVRLPHAKRIADYYRVRVTDIWPLPDIEWEF
jgi:lambda repressor-like predicted transcriptional regulator